GAEVEAGFGAAAAAPVLALNSSTHGRDGTVGRLLPGMQMRLEPFAGLEGGGRLLVRGMATSLGEISAEMPGTLRPHGDEWRDTGWLVCVDREGFITIRGPAERFASVAGKAVALDAVEELARA